MAHSSLGAADMKPPEHPLDVLPAMLNMVLIQTGKLLRDPDSHHPRAIGLTRSRINEFVPAANDRWHDALDEIEMKILDAKAVMERDLRAMRKKREERLGLKSVSKTPSPAEQEAVVIENVDLSALNVESLGNGTLQEGQNSDTDLVMLDAGSGDGGKASAGENGLVTAQGMPQDAANSAGLAISMPDATGGTDVKGPGDGTNGAKAADATATVGAGPAEQGDQSMDFDFDAMIKDGDFGGGDSMLDFDDFGFSMNETGNNAGSGDASLDNLGASAVADLTNGTSTTEDINSFMPGFDAYMNASNTQSGGTDNGANTGGNGGAAAAAAAIAAPTNTSNQEANNAAQPDNSLDDLFGGDFNFDADLNVDDEWLKMM